MSTKEFKTLSFEDLKFICVSAARSKKSWIPTMYCAHMLNEILDKSENDFDFIERSSNFLKKEIQRWAI